MARLGLRAYARHRGCALYAVQKAIVAGRISKGDDGLIDVEAADVAWAANTNVAKAPAAAEAVAEPAAPLLTGELIPAVAPGRPADWPSWDEWPEWQPGASEPPAAEGKGKFVDGDSFMAAKTRREWLALRREEREFAAEAGAAVSAEDVRKAFREIGRIVAGGRASVANEAAPKIVGMTDPNEIARVIREVVIAVDERIANEIAAKYADLAGGPVERSGTGS